MKRKSWLPMIGLLVLGVVAVRARRRPAAPPRRFVEGAEAILAHARQGRFQRSLSLVAGLSSVLAGTDVWMEHYRGSFGQRVMWTPVTLSTGMVIAGIWGALSRWAARTVLRWTSLATLLDGLVGFGFHVRGVARKPGGWRLPVQNVIMGPPIFAPLLLGVSAYLGLLASFLRPEEAPRIDVRSDEARFWDFLLRRKPAPWRVELREGRFQKHVAIVTVFSTFFSGFEALYSHYKTNFKYTAQWTPVIVAPLLMTAAAASVKSPRVGRTWLPALSVVAMLNGAAGFFYHLRGVLRRPGGWKHLPYNLLYGPPIFAPLLFAACGFYGLLASLMRREDAWTTRS